MSETLYWLPKFIRPIMRVFGIDRAIGLSMLIQALSILSRPLLLILMVHFLTIKEQGYQYSILSLLGVKAFFELGVGLAICQFVGREAGHLKLSREGVTGPALSLARVASIFQKTVIWYGLVGLVFAAAMLPLGWLFFAQSDTGVQVHWQGAWTVAVLTTAIGFAVDGAQHVLFGCGKISSILTIRLITTAVQTSVYGALLTSGAGLISAPIGNLVALICQILILGILFGPTFHVLWRHRIGDEGVRWMHEVFPLQWRLAVSWFSNYFCSQALIPIVFRHQSDVTAGQLGLTMAVGAILQGFAFSWIGTRLPKYAASIGQGRIHEVRRDFISDYIKAISVFLIGGLCGVLCLYLISEHLPHYGVRFLPAPILFLVLISSFSALSVECFANSLNGFLRDPLMAMRLLMAVVILTGGYLAARYASVATVALVMCVGSILTAVGSGIIWTRFFSDRLKDTPTAEHQ